MSDLPPTSSSGSPTHNAGGSVHTSKYKPWGLVSYHAFADERRAREFEFYLKSGSGKAFANKRLW
jgi:predicted GIY-YIG superfamily endonuclease